AALREAERLLAGETSRSLEAQRQVELLNQQTAALRQELNQLQGLIDASADADTEAQIRIETLGSDLNTALARVAAEERARATAEAARADAESRENELLVAEAARLEAEANDLRSFRSEFFGRMREVLGGRDELQVVGDRFVFSSEVLFEPGSATLGHEGEKQLSDLGRVIRELEQEIPPEINWILQVEGHTDATGSAVSNWELSQARALSVVRYLIDVENMAPEHLSAAGFGEFQPIAEGDSPEALAANRRIELKLTER
ncbi:MAG: OmpA family protein, partial [Rhodobacteraceae bacterium]|nr:OmpA family protein [Paracoccaceae bacterium]